MNKPHKHCELIHAYADGAEIQIKSGQLWLDIPNPHFYDIEEYRIKPRTVKREGWAVIYKYNDGTPYLKAKIFASEYDAERSCRSATAIIKMEWTEEVK